MKDAVAEADFIGAMKEYNETCGMKGVTFASVVSRYPGVSVTQLQRRVSGKVEANAKMGRPPSLTEGDKAAMREWVGEGAKTSDCRTPVQFNARMAKIAQTNGAPYADGVPSESSVRRAKKSMPSFGATSNGISTKQARIDTYDVDSIKPYFDYSGKIFRDHPILQEQPGRIANFDESPMGTRAEVNRVTVFYLGC